MMAEMELLLLIADEISKNKYRQGQKQGASVENAASGGGKCTFKN